ncbi:MAG: hypothetical protein RLW62_23600 [Gammaproteobacteria bacterium]
MSEFDLVPDSYRRTRRRRHAARCVLGGYAAMVALALVLVGQLRAEVDRLSATHARAQAEQALATGMLEELVRVQAAVATAQARLAVLEQLRGGPAVARLFSAIDAAMADGVWLSRWTFRRAGEPLAETAEGTPVPAYLTLVSIPDRPAWRLGSHMEIDGEARGHAELAAFVDRLLASADIVEVQILSTALARDAENVAFSLAVVVDETAPMRAARG